MSGRRHSPVTEPLLEEGFFAGTHPAAPDPYAHLAAARAAGPVLWNERGGYWVATQHAAVHDAAVDPGRFCSGQGILVFEIGHEYASPPTMMHTDPPEHTRYRSLVQPAFRPSLMRRLEDRMRGQLVDLLDPVPTGEPLDIVEHLTVPFPLLVICELLGMDSARWREFFVWSEISIPGATDHTEEERAALQGQMIHALISATAHKRDHPDEDVLSLLGQAGLSDLEIAMFGVQLLVAGNETTRNTLSAGIEALARHPEQWERLRADRSLLGTATEEIIRWACPVIYFMRTAVADTTLAGVDIAAGEHVVLHYTSACRDELAFGPSAGEFDVGRTVNPHLAFGFGPHYCIGAALARLEIRLTLEALLDRYSSLELAGEVERTPSAVIAGIRHVPILLRP